MLKKSIPVLVIFLFGALLSCLGNKDYDKVTKEVCSCMSTFDSENAMNLDLGIDMTPTNYAFCVKDISSVDLLESDFLECIDKNCLNLKQVHKKYVESLK